MNQSAVSVDTALELLGICERFEIPTPLPDACSTVVLAELIVRRIKENGGSVEATDVPVLHERIERTSLEILADPNNGFAPSFAQTQTVPLRTARMRFGRMLAEKTGLNVKYRNIPHAAYLPFALVLFALPILPHSLYAYLTMIIISIILAVLVWAYFTSKRRTITKLADYIVADNLDAMATVSQGDILRYLNRKFPSGIDSIDLKQRDE